MRKVKEIRDPLTDEIIYFKTHAGVVRMNNGMTVEDAVNLVINNHKSEDSGDTPEETIYTEDLTIVVDDITEGFIILILSEDGLILGTQTTNLQTHKINEGVKYYIVANDIEGYIAPNSTEVFTAVKYGYREVSMVYLKLLVTTIRINLTISDPAAMITRVVDNGGIEAIRANSHRYTGTFDSLTGVMTLKQLDDSDGTKYLDGSNADLTTLGNDVWMKLPLFYWKCEEYATDVWDFSVCYGVKPDDTWKDWDGKDLIGVYKAYYTSNKFYSVSGLVASGSNSLSKYKTWARNRGNGFTLIKWKHHCMMAMLFYTYYLTTNCFSICGEGGDTANNSYAVGGTNKLGMTDTPKDIGDVSFMNFWGLEAWWGGYEERIDNVMNKIITEDDNSTRNFPSDIVIAGSPSKLYFGEYIDLLPMDSQGSSTTGFCCYMSFNYTCLLRGRGLIGIVSSSLEDTASVRGSRLAFRGEIVIES